MKKMRICKYACTHGFLIAFLLILQLGWLPLAAHAAEGKVTVAVSPSTSVGVGEIVTVVASATGPNGVRASSTMEISYDTSMFSFVSCGADNYSGGDGGKVSSTASSYSIKLKAVASGNASIKVTGSGGKIVETQEALSSMVAAGASISVSGSSGGTESQDTTPSSDTQVPDSSKSADNSLSQLKLSKGTLSPEFKYSQTSYTATVPEDVTSIEVDAKPSNSKAVVESITGNTDLKPGENTIKITVKAENGVKALYTVVVTKSGTAVPEEEDAPEESEGSGETPDTEATEDGIIINGIAYEVTGEFSEEAIPEGFVKETLVYQGQEINGAKFSNGELWLLYLASEDENAKKGFYVYESDANLFQPFIRITNGSEPSMGERYVIPLPAGVAEAIPEGYDIAAVTVLETEGVSAYTYQGNDGGTDIGEFYLLFGMNSEGTKGWYRYDSIESTIQRHIESYAYSGSGQESEEVAGMAYLQDAYNKLEEKYTKGKSSSTRIIVILIFIVVVLVLAIINILLLKGRNAKEPLPFFKKKGKDIWDDDDDTEENLYDNSLEEEADPKWNYSQNAKEDIKGVFLDNPLKEKEEEYYDEDIKEEGGYDYKDSYPEPPNRIIGEEDDLEIIDLNDL